MSFQFLEDASAGGSEVMIQHIFNTVFRDTLNDPILIQQYRNGLINYAPTLIAPIPETIRESYNTIQNNKNNISHMGHTVNDNNVLGEQVIENLKFWLTKGISAPFRGIMRGEHYTVADQLLQALNINRSKPEEIPFWKHLATETLYQGTRNGLFQQLPWQIGQYFIYNTLFGKNGICAKKTNDEKTFYVKKIDGPLSNAEDIENGVPELPSFSKENIIKGIKDLQTNIRKMKEVALTINQYQKAYDKHMDEENDIELQEIQKAILPITENVDNEYTSSKDYTAIQMINDLPNTESEEHFKNIITYEQKNLLRKLTKEEKKDIANNIETLCDNANQTYILYDYILKENIEKIKCYFLLEQI